MTEKKEPMKVHEAISKVMEDVGAVRKDGRNNQQNFNFRGVDAVVNAVSPVMRKWGVTVHPSKVVKTAAAKQLSGGKVATSVDVTVDYTFTGPEGDEFTAQVVAEAFDLGDKATAKAMSVAYRTCLLQTFLLPTDDVDPDEQTYEREQHGQRPPQQQGPNWELLYNQALGNRQALEALRNQGKQAGAPAEMFTAIENELANMPVEGNVVANG